MNMIMHGNYHTEISGHNIVKYIPFMSELVDNDTKEEKFPGLFNNLSVKTSTSK